MAVFNTTTLEDFEAHVINNSKVVIVDFWAEWCPPCRAMAPVLHQLATKYDDKLDVVKINVEESQPNAALASRHGVQGIPNLFIYKDGKVVNNLVGMRPAPVLEQEIKALLD